MEVYRPGGMEVGAYALWDAPEAEGECGCVPVSIFMGTAAPLCGVVSRIFPHCLIFALLLVEMCIWNEVLLCVSSILDYM